MNGKHLVVSATKIGKHLMVVVTERRKHLVAAVTTDGRHLLDAVLCHYRAPCSKLRSTDRAAQKLQRPAVQEAHMYSSLELVQLSVAEEQGS